MHLPLACNGTAIPFPAPPAGSGHNFTVELYFLNGPYNHIRQSEVTGLSSANQWHVVRNAAVQIPAGKKNWLPGTDYVVKLHDGIPAKL